MGIQDLPGGGRRSADRKKLNCCDALRTAEAALRLTAPNSDSQISPPEHAGKVLASLRCSLPRRDSGTNI